ncbi:MAG: hypothetical protein JWN67_4085 [Actinomycetia bacterium]|nr:hypothetical protein [Actinomycetes bacterium]
MAELRTEVTELGTALGLFGFDSPERALSARPSQLLHVEPEHWKRLEVAMETLELRQAFHAAWLNGRSLLDATDGLRGRPPRRVEWKGPHKPPGYERLPADLRVDHVFLVSCKYVSKVLWNLAPTFLFDRCLEGRSDEPRADWFEVVAPQAYDDLYADVRAVVPGLPVALRDLVPADREVIKEACARKWPEPLEDPARRFATAVATATAARWHQQLTSHAARERMLWQLLRLNAAPYFILGSGPQGALRLRVGTPWDWRQHFSLRAFELEVADSLQPQVNWTAVVDDLEQRTDIVVRGHVEIRWSHGRFCGFPEAKVYLDSPHRDVPGYFELT